MSLVHGPALLLAQTARQNEEKRRKNPHTKNSSDLKILNQPTLINTVMSDVTSGAGLGSHDSGKARPMAALGIDVPMVSYSCVCVYEHICLY
jgi:hypothetical protein